MSAILDFQKHRVVTVKLNHSIRDASHLVHMQQSQKKNNFDYVPLFLAKLTKKANH